MCQKFADVLEVLHVHKTVGDATTAHNTKPFHIQDLARIIKLPIVWSVLDNKKDKRRAVCVPAFMEVKDTFCINH
jgi:hypothetical protein